MPEHKSSCNHADVIFVLCDEKYPCMMSALSQPHSMMSRKALIVSHNSSFMISSISQMLKVVGLSHLDFFTANHINTLLARLFCNRFGNMGIGVKSEHHNGIVESESLRGKSSKSL